VVHETLRDSARAMAQLRAIWLWDIWSYTGLKERTTTSGLTKSRLHDGTTTAQSGRRLHARLHAYRSLSLKFKITYFVFNRLTRYKFHQILICFGDALRIYRVRPNCIQHDHAVCVVRSACSASMVRSAVTIIMVQSVPDCVVVQSAFSRRTMPDHTAHYLPIL